MLTKFLTLPAVMALLAAIATKPKPPTPAAGLRPAMLVWEVGIGQPKPSYLVEVITPATYKERKTWRITHYPHDPTASTFNEYDLYELDRDTLAPVMRVVGNS